MQWNGTSSITSTGESPPLFASGDHAHNSVKGQILPCFIHAIDVMPDWCPLLHHNKISCVNSSDPIGLIYWTWVLWAIASEYSLCYTIQKDKPLTFQYTSFCNIKVFIKSHLHKTSTKYIPLPVLCVWKTLTGTNTIYTNNKVNSECKPVSYSGPDIRCV